jgi:hypothetical protein
MRSSAPSPPAVRSQLTPRPIHWVSLSAACALVDFLLGPKVQFPIAYLLPVSMAAWYGGRAWGVSLAVTLSLCRFAFNMFWDPEWMTIQDSAINALIRTVVFVTFAWLIDRTSRQMRDLRHMRLLEGILGVCSECRKIRDEGVDSWEPLEVYVGAHPQDFKTGMCPDCAKQHTGVFDRR